MKLAIVAGKSRLQSGLLIERILEWIGYGDAEMFLARVSIFRPDSPPAGAQRGRDNRAIVKTDAIRRTNLDGAANGLSIGSDQVGRRHCVQTFHNRIRIRRNRKSCAAEWPRIQPAPELKSLPCLHSLSSAAVARPAVFQDGLWRRHTRADLHRESGPLIKVLSLPLSGSHMVLKLLKTSFERFYFPALATRFSIFGGEFLRLGAHPPRQGGIALDGDLADLFYQFLVHRERDVPAPTILWDPIRCASRLLP